MTMRFKNWRRAFEMEQSIELVFKGQQTRFHKSWLYQKTKRVVTTLRIVMYYYDTTKGLLGSLHWTSHTLLRNTDGRLSGKEASAACRSKSEATKDLMFVLRLWEEISVLWQL